MTWTSSSAPPERSPSAARSKPAPTTAGVRLSTLPSESAVEALQAQRSATIFFSHNLFASELSHGVGAHLSQSGCSNMAWMLLRRVPMHTSNHLSTRLRASPPALKLSDGSVFAEAPHCCGHGRVPVIRQWEGTGKQEPKLRLGAQ